LLGGYPGKRLGARREETMMANPVPAGSDVSAGTYRCTNCSNEIQVGSTRHLPPCPKCGNGSYETVTGGDSIQDPYPEREEVRRTP
jgi:Zn finger protein HypA/HybF involved in hydrogenase expression